MSLLLWCLLWCAAAAHAQSNYDSQANNIEYQGEGLPEETLLDGKVRFMTHKVMDERNALRSVLRVGKLAKCTHCQNLETLRVLSCFSSAKVISNILTPNSPSHGPTLGYLVIFKHL